MTITDPFFYRDVNSRWPWRPFWKKLFLSRQCNINIIYLFGLTLDFWISWLLCEKSFVTFSTLIWSFPWMSPHMIYRMILICENLVTITAYNWFPSGVSFHVTNKIFTLIEILSTLSAFIWFLPSVNPHMNCEMGFWWEKISPTHCHYINCPVWPTIWLASWLFRENALSHSLHACDFSPVWDNIWRLSTPFPEKLLVF